jgi:hypothetical protein
LAKYNRKKPKVTLKALKAALLGADNIMEVAAALNLSRAQTFRYLQKYKLKGPKRPKAVVSVPVKPPARITMIYQYQRFMSTWREHNG